VESGALLVYAIVVLSRGRGFGLGVTEEQKELSLLLGEEDIMEWI
jgi:hypothetical protein